MPCFTGIDKKEREKKTKHQEENIYALFHRHRKKHTKSSNLTDPDAEKCPDREIYRNIWNMFVSFVPDLCSYTKA